MDELSKEFCIEDFKKLYYPLKEVESLITSYYFFRNNKNDFIENLLKTLSHIKYDVDGIIKNQIINGTIFSREIYQFVLSPYFEEDIKICNLQLITALMEQYMEDKFLCFPYDRNDLAEMYLKRISTYFWDGDCEPEDYDEYKEFLLDFCHKTNIYIHENTKIYQELKSIENSIVEHYVEEVNYMYNDVGYIIEDYEMILEKIEKYNCSKDYKDVIELKNFILDYKYSDLEDEYKALNKKYKQSKIDINEEIDRIEDLEENQEIINFIADEFSKHISECDYPDEMINLLVEYRKDGDKTLLQTILGEYTENTRELVAGHVALFKRHFINYDEVEETNDEDEEE